MSHFGTWKVFILMNGMFKENETNNNKERTHTLSIAIQKINYVVIRYKFKCRVDWVIQITNGYKIGMMKKRKKKKKNGEQYKKCKYKMYKIANLK